MHGGGDPANARALASRGGGAGNDAFENNRLRAGHGQRGLCLKDRKRGSQAVWKGDIVRVENGDIAAFGGADRQV